MRLSRLKRIIEDMGERNVFTRRECSRRSLARLIQEQFNHLNVARRGCSLEGGGVYIDTGILTVFPAAEASR